MSNCATQQQQQQQLKQTVDFNEEEEKQLRLCFGGAKVKARQQLQVSEDSPFSQQQTTINVTESLDELERVGAEKARLLREQSDEIQRQLEFVRTKLSELNAHADEDNHEDELKKFSRAEENDCRRQAVEQEQEQQDSAQHFPVVPGKRFFVSNQQVTSSDNQLNRNFSTPTGSDVTTNTTKVRPLTGAADCPNCVCDRRRRSICDKCARVAGVGHKKSPPRAPSFINTKVTQLPVATTIKPMTTNRISKQEEEVHNHQDERPIRPAKPEFTQLPEPEVQVKQVVDRVVVPGKLFTIGKSLDEKRTRLGQVISELQVMMEKVRQRGERLDEERKVAQLYREQWRFGPQIGGGGASRSYSSRLDPQLARDTNSLHNFRQIEPALRLRQYTPTPKPRLSKVSAQVQVNRVNLHTRSKSLESLGNRNRRPPTTSGPTVAPRISVRATPPRGVSVTNHSEPLALKSSSEVNLAPGGSGTSGAKDNDDEAQIEEELEESGELVDEAEDEKQNGSQQSRQSRGSPINRSEQAQVQVAVDRQQDKPVKRAAHATPATPTWVPVFGETEIKTIRRPAVQRKVAILSGATPTTRPKPSPQRPRPQSILRHRSHSAMTSATVTRQPRTGTGSGDRVLSEASRKLHFANELLESERRDSQQRNQLIVRDRMRPRPPAPPIKQQVGPWPAEVRHPCNCCATQPEMVRCSRVQTRRRNNQQQRQVIAGNDDDNQQVFKSPTQQASESSRQLIGHLRERLNRTRTKLARTLEAERSRHQRREQSSRRKHSSLEQENELLKHSLGQCIDTCLRDISSAFESLNDTLAIVVVDDDDGDSQSQFQSPTRSQSQSSCTGQSSARSQHDLENAAQLIADSQHLARMRAHIDQIEQQKRAIFEELTSERQRAQQLEAELQRAAASSRCGNHHELTSATDSSKRQAEEPRPSTSIGEPPPPVESDHNESSMSCRVNEPVPTSVNSTTTTTSEDSPQLSSNTFASLELYRQYIQSVTPDLDAIRRERRQILAEFDNIKQMLSDMDNNG